MFGWLGPNPVKVEDSVMRNDTIKVSHDFILARWLRVVLLCVATLFGALSAYLMPAGIGCQHGLLIILAVALLAGLSALWSP